MTKSICTGAVRLTGGENSKRRRLEKEEESVPGTASFASLNEDLLFEVMKHADGRTLARAACVSKNWERTAHDERLWEMICTRHWANIGYGALQVRSMVLALGGFRRLYALCLWPLLKPPSASLTTSFPTPAVAPKSNGKCTRWGKDEVHLSLCLLSIQFYEKMNYRKR